MNQVNNVVLKVLGYLEKNLDRTIFEFVGHPPITGRAFKNLIINFALNMKAKGVNQSSCIAIESSDITVATALNLASCLNGSKWVRLTSEALNSEHLDITHIFYQTDMDYKNNDIVISKIDRSWTMTPKGVEVSFPGYKSLDSTWAITQSSGTTGTAKFMEISYGKYWERVYNNNAYILEGVKKIGILYTPLKSTVQYRAVTHIISDIPIIVGLQYEDLPKHPGLLIAGSHQQSLALMRGKTPPETPYDVICELGGSATSRTQIASLLPHFKMVSSGYGSTETARTSIIKWTHIDQYEPFCVGKPYKDVELRIEDGIILLRTPRNISGYLGGEKFEWFQSGDMGYIDDEGKLYVTGRLNERLNIGGIKVDPNEVDAYIKSLGGVIDCLTFQDPELDVREQLSAMIITKLDVDLYSIFQQCKDKLGMSKTPKNFYLCSEFPTNENGKASRKDAMKAVEGMIPVKYIFP